MKPIEPGTVLVAIDFSEASRIALRQAAELCTRTDATLHVLHVHTESRRVIDLARALDLPLSSGRLDELPCRDELDRWVGEVHAPKVIPELSTGNAAEAIIASAQRAGADLIVLGAWGSGGAGRGTGVLATRVVRHAPCPVWLVHPDHPERPKQVVACVDLSDDSELVVAHAYGLARAYAVPVVVLHVWSGDTQAWPGVPDDWEGQLRGRLDKVRLCCGDPPPVETTTVLRVASHPADGIATQTVPVEGPLVVLGTRGRSSLRYVLLGSTAERTVRAAHGSVVAIPPAPL